MTRIIISLLYGYFAFTGGITFASNGFKLFGLCVALSGLAALGYWIYACIRLVIFDSDKQQVEYQPKHQRRNSYKPKHYSSC